MDKPETAIRTYPVNVIDMKGNAVKAGDPVELPLAKVKEHELRFNLLAADRDVSKIKKQAASTAEEAKRK